MLDVLKVINLVISKEISLKDSELKVTGTLTLVNIVIVEEKKYVLVSGSHNGFQGIMAPLETANIGQRIGHPRENLR